MLRRGKPIAKVILFADVSDRVPAWKQPDIRLQILGSDLSSAILEERELAQ